MPGPYGITPAGFNRKRADEILADLNTGVQGVFGVSVDLSPTSPDGQFNGLMADEIAFLWELAEDIYHSFDPFQAEGTRLDSVMAAFMHPPRLVTPTVETDAQYRARIYGTPLDITVQDSQETAPSLLASNLRDDLEIKLSQLAGVTYVKVIVNEEDTVDPVTGMPGHTYSVIINGGVDADIAEVIWSTHPTGIGTYGDTEVEHVDSTGKCRLIRFERPTLVNILIKYTVRVFRSACGCRIPSVADIQTTAADNLNDANCPYQVGELILLSRINGAISGEAGIEVCQTEIAVDGDPLDILNLQMAWNELPVIDPANITVDIVEVCP